MRIVTFGLGGYCENCDETHDHPVHNIVEIIELDDEILANEPPTD
jgi:hypothetical protein